MHVLWDRRRIDDAEPRYIHKTVSYHELRHARLSALFIPLICINYER